MRILEDIDRLLETTGAQVPSKHPIAYHGSDTDGIQKLGTRNPHYRGGIGSGVYVSYYKDVAEYYGKHLYKVRLRFRKSDVFVIDAGEVEWPRYLRGHSLLMGEFLQSFIFEVGGTKYLVSKEHWKSDAKEAFRLQYLASSMYEIDVPFEVFEILEIHEDMEVAFAQAPDLESEIPKLTEGLQDIIYAKWVDQGGDPDVDQSDPSEEYLDFEIQYMERIIDKLTEVYEKADDRFDDQFDYIIDLENVGRVVERAGYNAVWFAGMRGGRAPVNTELLVFDADDVEMVDQLK